jgi:hypothetical protein
LADNVLSQTVLARVLVTDCLRTVSLFVVDVDRHFVFHLATAHALQLIQSLRLWLSVIASAISQSRMISTSSRRVCANNCRVVQVLQNALSLAGNTGRPPLLLVVVVALMTVGMAAYEIVAWPTRMVQPVVFDRVLGGSCSVLPSSTSTKLTGTSASTSPTLVKCCSAANGARSMTV